jgi:hypothetical protein
MAFPDIVEMLIKSGSTGYLVDYRRKNAPTPAWALRGYRDRQ